MPTPVCTRGVGKDVYGSVKKSAIEKSDRFMCLLHVLLLIFKCLDN